MQALSSSFLHIYLESSVSLNIWIIILFLVNAQTNPQALLVNLGYFKCISVINLSRVNKNVLTVPFIFY